MCTQRILQAHSSCRLKSLVLLLLFPLATYAQTELIVNRDFSSTNSGWDESGDFHYNSTFTNCYSCPGYAWFADPAGQPGDDLFGYIEQSVTIPTNTISASFSFYTNITSAEVQSIAYDKLTVTISNGTDSYTIELSNVDETSGYVLKSYNLQDISDYAGEDFTVRFEADNDGSKPTTFRVDDVSLTVQTQNSPNLTYAGHQILDDGTGISSGDGDGLAEPDEKIQLNLQLYNSGNEDATNVEVTLSENDPHITLTDADRSFGTIDAGSDDWANGFDFDVDASCPDKDVIFTMNITSDEGTWPGQFTVHIHNTNVSAPTVRITSPNGGENWRVGSTHTISADINGTISGKQIEYSTDGGTVWKPIWGYTTTNTSLSYDWSIPNDISTDCKVRVTALYSGGSISDISDAFTISDIPGIDFELNYDGISHLYWPFYNPDEMSPDADYHVFSEWEGNGHDRGSICSSPGTPNPTWWYCNSHYWNDNRWHHSGDHCFAQDWSINGDDCGDYFFSPLAGTIVEMYSGCNPTNECTKDCTENDHSFGNYIVIETIDNMNRKFWFRCGHFRRLNTNFEQGYNIVVGEFIGQVGSEGASSGPHVHVSLHRDDGTGLTLSNNSDSGIDINDPDQLCSTGSLTTQAANFAFDAEDDGSGGGTFAESLPSVKIKIDILPNPNNGEFVLNISNAESSNEYQVLIFDVTGRIFYEQSYAVYSNKRLTTKIALNEIPAGFYFLKVYSDDILSGAESFVVQR